MNGAMVRAVLNGTKTQTRRDVKLPKHHVWGMDYEGQILYRPEDLSKIGDFSIDELSCPHGKVGDLLWVRENWAFHLQSIGSATDEDGPFVYAADEFAQQYRLDDKWTPSIHMPRFASRILLEIVSVRVERLNDISEADARAEGISRTKDGAFHVEDDKFRAPSAKESYARLWESINGEGSWNTNPWVWVVEFEVVKA
jgi:hypothetical protein